MLLGQGIIACSISTLTKKVWYGDNCPTSLKPSILFVKDVKTMAPAMYNNLHPTTFCRAMCQEQVAYENHTRPLFTAGVYTASNNTYAKKAVWPWDRQAFNTL